MTFADSAEIEPDPIEIDPRPCDLCGCTIDQHERVDTPEGPEFFCEDVEREIYLAALSLVLSWEQYDPRDAWKYTGEPRPKASEYPMPARAPYRTPKATIDAFRIVVAAGDADRLKAWLLARPKDAPFLLALLESSASC